jgi:hypothetical protein
VGKVDQLRPRIQRPPFVAPLKDRDVLAAFKSALSENLRFAGFVTWKPRAAAWVKENLEGYTTKAVAELMLSHIESGGEIDQVRERREEWIQFDFHYDFRLRVGDRLVYIETILVRADPNDPQVQIVNIHDA